jgi:hypothetical protein
VLLCLLTGRARNVRRMHNREIGVVGPFFLVELVLSFVTGTFMCR